MGLSEEKMKEQFNVFKLSKDILQDDSIKN